MYISLLHLLRSLLLLLALAQETLHDLNRWIFFFFLMWTVFRLFIEFVTVLLLFYVLVFQPGGIWDLISLTRDQTSPPAREGEVC